MSDNAVLLLKYFASALSVAIPFAGAWFFEYTQVDKATGKRVLTPAGRWAVVFALISLGCAGFLSVWTDREGAQKQAKQQVQIDRERLEVSGWRNKTLELQVQAQKIELENKEINKGNGELLAVLVQNLDKLSPESRSKVREAVQSLNTVEDIKTQYPQLYKDLESARTFSKVEEVFNKASSETLRKRVGDCGSEVQLVEFVAGYSKGQVFDLSNGMTIGLMIDPTGVKIDVTDATRKADLKDGYNFVFGNRESPKLQCGINKGDVFIRCEDWVRGPELAVYELLRTKPLTGIKIKMETYPVAPQLADRIMNTFACIKP